MRHPFTGKGAISYWLAWVALMLIHASLFRYYYSFSNSISFVDSFVYNSLIAGIGLSFWFVIKYTSSGNQKSLNSITSLIGSILIAVVIATNSGEWLTSLFISDSTYIDFVQKTMLWRTIISTLYIIFIILIYNLIRHQTSLRLKEAEEGKLQALLKQSELDVLKFQINPHFIFNSLNSISSLTISSPPKAQEMVIKLSEFLRSSLGKENDHLQALDKELNQMNLYLDIEKIRFGDRLHLQSQVGDECSRLTIPSMILQPLYENAIKYSVYEHTGEVIINTTCECKDDHLIVSISNTHSEDSGVRKGKGIGLQNVKNRLQLLYNTNNLLHIEKNESKFKVTLQIPQKNI